MSIPLIRHSLILTPSTSPDDGFTWTYLATDWRGSIVKKDRGDDHQTEIDADAIRYSLVYINPMEDPPETFRMSEPDPATGAVTVQWETMVPGDTEDVIRGLDTGSDEIEPSLSPGGQKVTIEIRYRSWETGNPWTALRKSLRDLGLVPVADSWVETSPEGYVGGNAQTFALPSRSFVWVDTSAGWRRYIEERLDHTPSVEANSEEAGDPVFHLGWLALRPMGSPYFPPGQGCAIRPKEGSTFLGVCDAQYRRYTPA